MALRLSGGTWSSGSEPLHEPSAPLLQATLWATESLAEGAVRVTWIRNAVAWNRRNIVYPLQTRGRVRSGIIWSVANFTAYHSRKVRGVINNKGGEFVICLAEWLSEHNAAKWMNMIRWVFGALIESAASALVIDRIVTHTR